MASSSAPITGAPDMSAVPEGAKAAGASADEMMARLARGENPYGEPAQPPAQQPQEPEQPPKPTNPTPERTPPAKATQEPQQDQQPEHREPQPGDKPLTAQEWEHKFKSLQGQLNRTNELLRTAREDANSLRNIISTLESVGTSTPAATSDAIDEVPDLTDEEKSEYGPEFLTVVGKIVARETASLKRENADLKKQVGGVANANKQSARERFVAGMDEKVPTWRVVNDDQEFIDWLQNPQEGTLQSRQELLVAAYGRNDVDRVAYYFDKFLRDVRGEEPAQSGQVSSETGGRAAAPPRRQLEDFAAPGKGRQGVAPKADADKPPISRAEITQFYTDVRTGVYAGRDADRLKREKEIFDASNEGRVR